MSEAVSETDSTLNVKPGTRNLLLIVLGFALANVGAIVEYMLPNLKEHFVTHQQFKEIKQEIKGIQLEIKDLTNALKKES